MIDDLNIRTNVLAAQKSAAQAGVNLREKFYYAKGTDTYDHVLKIVQGDVAKKIYGDIQDHSELELKNIIRKHLTDTKITCELTESVDELTEYIYHDMAGYSFISREGLLDIEGFEELNINSWDDVDIKVSGIMKKTDYKFLNPQHAIDIHQRMLRKTNITLDDAMPRRIADLGANIRICVEKTPIVDAEVGIASSIRKVSSDTITREKLVESKSVNNEMLDFLLCCLSHGAPVCISGETGSGKTTLAGFLLSIVSKDIRTITIEEGSREWSFVRRDNNGKVTNSVVHMKTRPSENPDQNIDQGKLVEDVLRLDPVIVGVGEMRSKEAFAVMEVAMTGHTVITTIHADSNRDAPTRVITLAKKAYEFDDITLLGMAARAFPILVHMDILSDNMRHITEITEITGFENGEIKYNDLYNYIIEDNAKQADGSYKVTGDFKKVGTPSHKLMQKLLRKGATKAELERFANKESDMN